MPDTILGNGKQLQFKKIQDLYPQVDCTQSGKTDTNQINTTYTQKLQVQKLQAMNKRYEGKKTAYFENG